MIMIDQYGRMIDYMRISITDRCNLRCRYCMPEDIWHAGHQDILRYEEMLCICQAAVSLGITKFKVTGGEPLVRKGCTDFIASLKSQPGVEQVTITTNGLLLSGSLDALCTAGIDGINISLDTLRAEEYCELTGFDGKPVETIRQALRECVNRGVRVKVNALLLAQTFGGIGEVAMLAHELPVDVRFIELMPIGQGMAMVGVPVDDAFRLLKKLWPNIYPTNEKRGNGPAQYFAARGLQGRIGLIGAVSNRFCSNCNRVRLTATGILKPCLCYEAGIDLKAILRDNYGDFALRAAMRSCITQKPFSHCFSECKDITEHRAMNQIGG